MTYFSSLTWPLFRTFPKKMKLELCYYPVMTMQSKITEKLKVAFSAEYLEVVDESYMHNVPEGSESHFKVTLVSDEFVGKMLIVRHRLVNKVLEEELQNGVHALALHTMTMEEWFAKGKAPESPECLGGGK